MFYIEYGVGGYCENCDPSHDHPLNNIVASGEIPDPVPTTDVQVIAEALSTLPPEQLDAIKQALGLI